jgi:putative transposase
MPQYLRAVVPGGMFFFTVTLIDRRRKLLTEHFDDLWVSPMVARRPFTVEAIVILPDRRLEIE